MQTRRQHVGPRSPGEDHCQDNSQTPHPQKRAPGEAPRRYSSEAPGIRRLHWSKSSHGPRDPRPKGIQPSSRGLTEPGGPRPAKQPL
ncbi:hypothetical protein CRENBAI_002089 [Crenichthys baileyi]|uniref:Uncharacterized protein n=1 Tax=Crenichthys baileyi TaxID=28760 RepID=A0AAV9RBV0_9TELE